ncbi:MAG: Ig-like domain-containing protein [Saprospiraceae bacterium]|nr:Ig-like domain-containing protein [Saprospiraceae bacterium]
MKVYHKIILSLLAFLFMAGCERDLDGLDEATFPTTPEVFIDGFSAGLNYAAFGGSDVKAFDVDEDVAYQGTASMRIAVPDRNDPKGAYAGGVYFTSVGRDLSSYNVLTFWAKASKAANVDLIGFGNDLGENKYQAAITNVPVNTNWQKYYIPIPDASKLTNERGMFFYSEGAEEDRGYTFWIDEVKFEDLGTVKNVRGMIQGGEDVVVSAETGATYNITAIASANLPNGIDQQVQTAPAYFEFSSSNPAVASVSNTGEVKVMDAGSAVITAKLGDQEAQGSLTVNSTGAPVLPATPAPKPSQDASKVISLFSNEYTNVPVDFFNGYWQFSTTQLANIQVSGDDILR